MYSGIQSSVQPFCFVKILHNDLFLSAQASEEEAKTARSEATELRTQVHQQLQQVQEVRDAVRGETSQLSEKLCNSETARETVQGQLAEAEEALRNSANAIEELHDQVCLKVHIINLHSLQNLVCRAHNFQMHVHGVTDHNNT